MRTVKGAQARAHARVCLPTMGSLIRAEQILSPLCFRWKTSDEECLGFRKKIILEFTVLCRRMEPWIRCPYTVNWVISESLISDNQEIEVYPFLEYENIEFGKGIIESESIQ